MHPRKSKFGFLTVSTTAQRGDTLKGVFARSKRKTGKAVTLAPIGEKKHGRPAKTKSDK
jgi:hypothetical protein